MKMFKKLTLAITLIASGLCSCFAAAPDSITLKGLTLSSFSFEDVTIMEQPVCSLDTVNNKKSSLNYYVEGTVCPTDGTKCILSAIIMKLNGKLTILKEVTSTDNSATYKNEEFTVATKRTLIQNEAMDDEGSDVKYNLIIKTKNNQVNVEMFGYCGI